MKVYEIQAEYEALTAMNEALMNLDGDDAQVMKDDLLKQFAELESEASNKAENIVKLIKNLEAESKAFGDEVERLNKKKKSRDNQISYLKTSLLKPLLLKKESGKIDTGLFKLSLRKSESVNIIDADIVPMIYKSVKKTVTIDKKELKKELKNGGVQGAELIENKSVQIK